MNPSVKDRLTAGRGTHLKRAWHDAVDPGCGRHSGVRRVASAVGQGARYVTFVHEYLATV